MLHTREKMQVIFVPMSPADSKLRNDLLLSYMLRLRLINNVSVRQVLSSLQEILHHHGQGLAIMA